MPFFGVQTLTLTATSRLAEMGRARVVPFYPERLPGHRYRVVFGPALEQFPTEVVHKPVALRALLCGDIVGGVAFNKTNIAA